MAESPLRLIKRCAEYQAKDQVRFLPPKRRGLYVLYQRRRVRGRETFAVVYIGLATASMRKRLASHRRSKGTRWSHFSVFEVWDNIRNDEIVELEGLFRFVYKNDHRASRLNVQRGFKKMREVRANNLADWND